MLPPHTPIMMPIIRSCFLDAGGPQVSIWGRGDPKISSCNDSTWIGTEMNNMHVLGDAVVAHVLLARVDGMVKCGKSTLVHFPEY